MRPKRYAIGSKDYPGLGKLVEECGELSDVLGKVIGCGSMDHWTGDLTDRLIDEAGDVVGAIAFFGELNWTEEQMERFMTRTKDKAELFARWHKEQTNAT